VPFVADGEVATEGGAEARTAGPALPEDLEEAAAAIRRGGQGGGASLASAGAAAAAGGGGAGAAASSATGLPANALEWVRSIGLGVYADKMRAAGLVRLELAARLTDDECRRIQATPAHRTKLLAASARLAERLRQRGRALPSSRGGDGAPAYTAATEIHYDSETGTFWGADGSVDVADGGGGGGASAGEQAGPAAGGGGGGKGGGKGGGRGGGGRGGRGGPPDEAQRRRNEANKAKVANHSRKAGAARKMQRGGFAP